MAAPGRGRWRGGRWRGVTVVIDPVARHPPRPRHILTLLAGRAYQPADGVRAPARHQCPGTVVCLPERRRVREPHDAARHVAPGSRYPDLITDDTVFGDSNRMKQRVRAPGRPRRLSARSRAHQSQCHHPACPASRARRQGMPGHRPCTHPAPPASCRLHTTRQQGEPGGGEPHRDSGAAPRLSPACRTPSRHPPLPQAPGGWFRSA